MLDYLGQSTGATMPAAVPGNGQLSPGMNPVSPAPVSTGGPSPMLAPGPGPVPQYVAVTQQDGSILLHVKNADGSLGPAVKIVNAVKPNKNASGAPQ